MPTMDNYQDENYDFEGNERALVAALRQAAERQKYGRDLAANAGANPFYAIAGVLERKAGRDDMEKYETRQTAMGAEKSRRIADLVNRISTPGTHSVLQQTLGGNDAPLAGQNVAPPTQADVPLGPVEENQRKTGLAMALHRLDPGMATPFIAQGAAFPERMAQMKEKEQAARDAATERTRVEAIEREENSANRIAQIKAAAIAAAANRVAPQGRDPYAHRQLISETQPDGTVVQKVIDLSKIEPGTTFGAKPVAETPSQAKAKLAKENADKAKGAIADTVANMKDAADELYKQGGMSSNKDSTATNFKSYFASRNPVSAFVGSMAGTDAANTRLRVEALQKDLLLQMKDAKAMGVGQMNSDTELRTWLSRLGDVTKMTKEAYKQNLDDFRDSITGKKPLPGTKATVDGTSAGGMSDEELKKLYGL